MRADKWCERTGPVGNGCSRGIDTKTGKEGYFDDYGNFIYDPEPAAPQYDPESDPEFQRRLQKLEEQYDEPSPQQPSSSSAPQPDPGMGALPIFMGIFAGVAMAEHDAQRRRQRQAYSAPPPPPAAPSPAKAEKKSGFWDYVFGFAFIILAIRMAGLLLMTLFGSCTLPRLLLNLVGSIVLLAVLLFLSIRSEKRRNKKPPTIPPYIY